MELPPGHMGMIVGRSSLALKTLIPLGGIVDEDYRGEIKVIMYNGSEEEFLVSQGDRIAQILVYKIPDLTVKQVTTLAPSRRGEGGFGSTGKS